MSLRRFLLRKAATTFGAGASSSCRVCAPAAAAAYAASASWRGERAARAVAALAAVGAAVALTLDAQQADEGDASGVAVGCSVYNANNPLEDRHIMHLSGEKGLVAAVFDGHGGWQAADFAKNRFVSVLQKELHNGSATPETTSVDPVALALSRSFLRLDREFLFQVKSAFEVGFGDVARAGACALVAMVTPGGRIYIANAGDCRAVLGRRANAGSGVSKGLQAVPLSRDHNAREAEEQERLRVLHPFEEDIIRCKRPTSCYVKGRLQPTRSLGDAYLKYSEFNGRPGLRSSGRHLPPPYTPPYITAEPEVNRHEIDADRDELLLLGSDGLWDFLSNEEAIEIAAGALTAGRGPEGACDALIEEVLRKAAKNCGLSVEELKNLPAGSDRRRKHDDITCICIDLSEVAIQSYEAEP